jgi:hypothetical protein
MSILRAKARRHGIKSRYAGDEPRNDELTAHWPKPKRTALPKRTAKWRRKEKINKRVAEADTDEINRQPSCMAYGPHHE